MRCPICLEPWETDTLHDMIAEAHPDKPWYDKDRNYNDKLYSKFFKEAHTEFQKKGCEYFGTSHGDINPSAEQKAIVAIAYEIMGDDVDGIESALDDAEWLGFLD